MQLPLPLISGKLIRRYKRFLADIILADGNPVTAHCPNSGSMMGCDIPGSPVLISRSHNPNRKLKYTWELVKVNGVWVGINTNHPNKLVREAIERQRLPLFKDYPTVRSEVPYSQNSRIDLLLERDAERCYIEVKNVTLIAGNMAKFPDARTIRGQKHLHALMEMVRQGYRAVNFFVVNRGDAVGMTVADDIDPVYGKLLREAHSAGVEIIAYQTRINPPMIELFRPLPVIL